jgi:hypothetical protein
MSGCDYESCDGKHCDEKRFHETVSTADEDDSGHDRIDLQYGQNANQDASEEGFQFGSLPVY